MVAVFPFFNIYEKEAVSKVVKAAKIRKKVIY